MKEGGYKRLKERCFKWIRKAQWPRRTDVLMWPKNSLGSDLATLHGKLLLAQKMGWEGRVQADDSGLRFEVVQKPREFDFS